MKTKIQILILTFFSFFFTTVHAQNKGEIILDKTANNINSGNGIYASFNISQQQRNIKGEIYMKKNKFYIKTPYTYIWSDGKTCWTYLVANKEVSVTNTNQSQQATLNPYYFLVLYKSGYNIKLINSKENSYTVYLQSKDPKLKIESCYITSSKKYILQAIKFKYRGRWTNIKITNTKRMNLTDNIFKFNKRKYPNAEIIDLR